MHQMTQVGSIIFREYGRNSRKLMVGFTFTKLIFLLLCVSCSFYPNKAGMVGSWVRDIPSPVDHEYQIHKKEIDKKAGIASVRTGISYTHVFTNTTEIAVPFIPEMNGYAMLFDGR